MSLSVRSTAPRTSASVGSSPGSNETEKWYIGRCTRLPDPATSSSISAHAPRASSASVFRVSAHSTRSGSFSVR